MPPCWSHSAAYTPLYSDSSPFRLHASVWHAEPVPGRLPLFSTVVQPELLFHLAGLLGSLCLGFFVLKWAQARYPSRGDAVGCCVGSAQSTAWHLVRTGQALGVTVPPPVS